MDTITSYKDILKRAFELRASRVPVNKPTLERRVLTNNEGSEFILVSTGFHNHTFHHDILLHVQIKQDKIFILEDVTDPGIYETMTEQGILSEDIVPIYMPDYDFETMGV